MAAGPRCQQRPYAPAAPRRWAAQAFPRSCRRAPTRATPGGRDPGIRRQLPVGRAVKAEEAAPAGGAAPPEVDHVALVSELLASKGGAVLVAQTAPAVRVSIGEEFGMPPGAVATGKLIAALRALGFDYVFDTLVGADLTIVEEGQELMDRLLAKLEGRSDAPPLPMITSCCPGWINYVEHCAPEMIPYISTCKSPHMMMGALIKNFYSKKVGKSDREVVVVSIMPCLRKQGEADRIMMQTDSGARDVDHVLTTRDCAALIRQAGLDLPSLPDSPYDDFLGLGSGAAALFGTTGGVMEAAVRTVYEVATSERLPRLGFDDVRGLEGVREAAITIAPHPEGPLHNAQELTLRLAVANGLGNAKRLVAAVQSGQKQYDFIEVMACPGGCIGGGGQPRSRDRDILRLRQQALYGVDERATLRRSHDNPVVQRLYQEYLGGAPLSEPAHRLLHTYYVECGPPAFDIAKAAASQRAAASAEEREESGPSCPLPEQPEECDVAVCDVDQPEGTACGAQCDFCGAALQ